MPTLFIWGALDPTPAPAPEADAEAAGASGDGPDGAAHHPGFALPTLDPPSLYAASLLRLLPVVSPFRLRLATPSPLLHAIVPRLEFDGDGGDEAGAGAGAGVRAGLGLGTQRPHAARMDVLEGIAPIEAFARTPSAAQLRHSVDDAFRTTASSASTSARALALHAVISHQLEPLALHALFSHSANFAALAVPTYSYTYVPPSRRHRAAPETIVQRTEKFLAAPVHIRPQLRAGVQAQLVRRGLWGLAGGAEEERAREKRAGRGKRLGKDLDAQDGPTRVPLGAAEKSSGIAGSTRKEMQAGWDRAKLTALAKVPFDVLNASLESSPSHGGETWLLGSSEPTSLDAHLFSVLAPILFPGPLLSTSTVNHDKDGDGKTKTSLPLARLLRKEYPDLVAHTSRLGRRLWSVQPAPSSSSNVVGAPSSDTAQATRTAAEWYWSPHGHTTVEVAGLETRSLAQGGNAGITLRSAAHLLASSVAAAPGAAWSSLRSYLSPSSSSARRRRQQERGQNAADGEDGGGGGGFGRPENLGWGRVIWLSSAVVGFVSFLFVSGIIQVEFVDPDAEEADEDDEEGQVEDDGGDSERAIDEEEELLEEGEEEAHEHVGEEEEGGELNDMYVEDDFDDDDE